MELNSHTEAIMPEERSLELTEVHKRDTLHEHFSKASVFGTVDMKIVTCRILDGLECLKSDTTYKIKTLRVDGGVTQNEFLMQFICDMEQVPVDKGERKNWKPRF